MSIKIKTVPAGILDVIEQYVINKCGYERYIVYEMRFILHYTVVVHIVVVVRIYS